jgi:hypothetical protein
MVQRTCTDGFQAPQLRRFFIVSSQSYGELDGLLQAGCRHPEFATERPQLAAPVIARFAG